MLVFETLDTQLTVLEVNRQYFGSAVPAQKAMWSLYQGVVFGMPNCLKTKEKHSSAEWCKLICQEQHIVAMCRSHGLQMC